MPSVLTEPPTCQVQASVTKHTIMKNFVQAHSKKMAVLTADSMKSK